VEQKGLFKKGFTPAGEDPAFWPIPLLNEINYYIVNKEYLTNSSGPGIWGVPPAEIAERYAPMKETIQRVKTAYEIIAYPHCKDRGRQDNIKSELERDQQSFDRHSVELNEEELGMLRKLAAARGLPCDSEKRVYEYSEVIGSSPSAKPLITQK
jgi:hypothetical protein